MAYLTVNYVVHFINEKLIARSGFIVNRRKTVYKSIDIDENFTEKHKKLTYTKFKKSEINK